MIAVSKTVSELTDHESTEILIGLTNPGSECQQEVRNRHGSQTPIALVVDEKDRVVSWSRLTSGEVSKLSKDSRERIPAVAVSRNWLLRFSKLSRRLTPTEIRLFLLRSSSESQRQSASNAYGCSAGTAKTGSRQVETLRWFRCRDGDG